MILKTIKKALQTYVEFEKALLQVEMIMGNKKILITDDVERLNKAIKSDLVNRIVHDKDKVIKEKEISEILRNRLMESENKIEGFKVLTEIQKRKLDYYKAELADSKEAYFGLCVNLDMGLQK